MRAAGIILAALLLGSCGLRPLYEGGAQGPIARSLTSVQVAPISGQAGWLLRNKLVDRIGQTGQGAAAYRLDVSLDDSITSYGLRSDQVATQERRTLRARYQLVNMSSGMVVLDASAGSDVSIDVVSSEYATVAAEQTALDNLTDAVADQIFARLSVYAMHATSAK